MSEDALRIRKLKMQVEFMREMIEIMDKNLAELTRCPTPKLPTFVYEDL